MQANSKDKHSQRYTQTHSGMHGVETATLFGGWKRNQMARLREKYQKQHSSNVCSLLMATGFCLSTDLDDGDRDSRTGQRAGTP